MNSAASIRTGAAVLQGADDGRADLVGALAHPEPALAPVGEPVLVVDVVAYLYRLVDRACRHVHGDSPTTSRSTSLAQKCAQFLGAWQDAYPLSEPAVAAAAAAYPPSGQQTRRKTTAQDRRHDQLPRLISQR